MQEPESVNPLKSARFALMHRGTELKDRHQGQVDEWPHDTVSSYRMKKPIRRILSKICAMAVKGKLEEWGAWVKTSRLEPMKTVLHLVLTRMQGILNIFRLGKSNVNAESFSARIRAAWIKSRGHRNYEAFKRNISEGWSCIRFSLLAPHILA